MTSGALQTRAGRGPRELRPWGWPGALGAGLIVAAVFTAAWLVPATRAEFDEVHAAGGHPRGDTQPAQHMLIRHRHRQSHWFSLLTFAELLLLLNGGSESPGSGVSPGCGCPAQRRKKMRCLSSARKATTSASSESVSLSRA